MARNHCIGRNFRIAALASAAALALYPSLACAQPARMSEVNIKAQDLGDALTEAGRQTRTEIIFSPSAVAGKTAPAVEGNLSAQETVARLLAGSGLSARQTRTGAFVVEGTPQGNGLAGGPNAGIRQGAASVGEGEVAGTAAENETGEGQQIVVTGTRIKGAPPMSPVTEITQKEIRQSGMTSVGEVVRSLPQNFNGGQNPGISLGSNKNNVGNSNYTGASSINLRGLGPDATLTLLNGHRLSYESSVQGVDLSTIPVAALQRIEIVADGASAIYGSDAVAGVANVIMKPDYDGVSISARIGGATEGGDFQQQYGIVAGKRWSTGGFIASYDFENDTAIDVSQRSYTKLLYRPTDLLPPQRIHAVFLSGHQDVGSWATLSFDALYSHRFSNDILTTSPPTSPNATSPNPRSVNSLSIAPKLDFHLPHGWEASIDGLYSRDHAVVGSFAGNAPGPYQLLDRNCLCNSTKSVEFTANGPLFALPGGDIRLALGGGYHQTAFKNTYLFPIGVNGYGGSRHSYYAFGEAYLPFISPGQHVPGIANLSANLAMRYERYNDVGSVATPKLGAKYSPVEDISFETSWGKSFKAPTLFQEYLTRAAYLYKPTLLGGSDRTPGDTVLYLYGGNPDLRPEHATTWTDTVSWRPRNHPGLHAEVSYFQVAYNGRVVLPIQPATVALSNPNFTQFIVYGPTPGEVEADVASAPAGLLNFSGYPYNPATVIAVVNNIYTNVVRQDIHGVDASFVYPFPLAGGTATLTAAGTWLVSHQKTTATSAPTALAGTAFYPPHLRSRDGISWEKRGLVLSAFLNYIGGVRDVFVTPNTEGHSMTTVDVTAV